MIDVIINNTSGDADKQKVVAKLDEIFRSGGVEARVSVVGHGSALPDVAHRAARGPADTIVAGGGDGTISTVASAVVGTRKTLGIIPLGTLNHFARDLKISLDLATAAQTVIRAFKTCVDVGEVNGRIFLNNSSLGLYPSIVRQREKRERLGAGKSPAFVWAALSVLRRYPFLNVRLSAEGRYFASRTPFVFVGNNEYTMESFNIGARASLNSGCLCVYVSHNTGRLGLLKLAARALVKRLRNAEDFLSLRVGEVRIETHRDYVRVATDGEVTMMTPPLCYVIRPRALRVIVPEPHAAAK